MSERAPLLIEIGCEEIPARMIPSAASEVRSRLSRILEAAGLEPGAASSSWGSRRIAVRVEDVRGRQDDREERIVGPPAQVAIGADGKLTPAGEGFARKHGVSPDSLVTLETDKGPRVGFTRQVTGLGVGELLARELPSAVASISFPKTMRWGEGAFRWVRPVHWLVALHGKTVLSFSLFGIPSGKQSAGHRFRSSGPVEIDHPDRYAGALEDACVLIDPARRKEQIDAGLSTAAASLGGRVLADPGLLNEVSDLVEWPGVVEGRFDPGYLGLPRELLITTLRHHQKCFAVEDEKQSLLPAFLAVANTDQDPSGHVRRGNEWVVGGRLEDARFFWNEDRKSSLSARATTLERVVFHGKLGSYADKARRTEKLVDALARRVGLDGAVGDAARSAAALCKNDLVTGTVGEFPELQGRAGGLLLAAEGEDEAIWRAVYEHYQPAGPDDPEPTSDAGGLVSIADKLDSIRQLIGVGEIPSGSRDPFGLRRAGSGVFRVLLARGWALSIEDLVDAAEGDDACREFLLDRVRNFLRDQGSTPNEILAVLRPRVEPAAAGSLTLPDIVARLTALRAVRERSDFAHLVDLTKRVDNILSKGGDEFRSALEQVGDSAAFEENHPAAINLWAMVEERASVIAEHEDRMRYAEIVQVLAGFVEPVERFFADVLVLDPKNPRATLHRREWLTKLKSVLTRCFDIRELAGQAERRK